MQTEVKQNIGTALQSPNKGGVYRRYIKRPMDFILSLIAIIVLSPVFLVVAVLVRVKLGSPIIFKQERPGLNEKIFTLYKFRSMTDERDENGELLPDSFRLTKFGRFLRSTSLDQLPEFFNIFKGDMSIVGPRPQLIRDMVFMSQKQRMRHSVLPGLTGWAQINGRDELSIEAKSKLDGEYMEKMGFVIDIKCLVGTISSVCKQAGVVEGATRKSGDKEVAVAKEQVNQS